jgi:hypothetical protein
MPLGGPAEPQQEDDRPNEQEKGPNTDKFPFHTTPIDTADLRFRISSPAYQRLLTSSPTVAETYARLLRIRDSLRRLLQWQRLTLVSCNGLREGRLTGAREETARSRAWS